MNEQGTGFRTQIVGGFQRDDVLQYIEQTSRSFNERIASLEQELEAARQEIDSFRTLTEEQDAKNDELSAKDAELLQRLGSMTLTEDTLRNSLADTQAELDTQNAAVKKLTAENAALQETNAALTGEITELRRKCSEYEAAKEHMAEIELRAYRQAKELEQKSQAEAERLKSEAAAVVEQFRQRLRATNDSYRAAFSRAQEELTAMHRHTSSLLDSLDSASQQLGRAKPQKTDSAKGQPANAAPGRGKDGK